VVRQLIAVHPRFDAQLVVCGEQHGANAKVSTLVQLRRLAKHDVILVSDADVHVPPDFLANVVAPLRDPGAGLVTCFYRLANPATLAMQWEVIAVNADFWSQVLQSRSLKPMDFALGAVMATTRKHLDAIGGFEALADCLADDYQIGNRIAQRGGRIEISPVVVECWESPKTWRQLWLHQLRWARTIRVCRPVPFFFSIVSNATLWPLLLLLAGGSEPGLEWNRTLDSPLSIGKVTVSDFHVFITVPWTAVAFLICLFVRIVTVASNRARLEYSHAGLAFFWLIPIKDLLNALIWALAFLGNRVEWRGQTYHVKSGGKLVPSPGGRSVE
jgi:ceramide glucosyltransferase